MEHEYSGVTETVVSIIMNMPYIQEENLFIVDAIGTVLVSSFLVSVLFWLLIRGSTVEIRHLIICGGGN